MVGRKERRKTWSRPRRKRREEGLWQIRWAGSFESISRRAPRHSSGLRCPCSSKAAGSRPFSGSSISRSSRRVAPSLPSTRPRASRRAGRRAKGPAARSAALASSPSGVLDGATNNGSLITINTSTGAVTTIGSNLPEGTDALVFTNSALGGGNALLNVPALGHAVLLALGAALALAGFFLVRLR